MYPSTTDLITRALLWYCNESNATNAEIHAYLQALADAGLAREIISEIDKAIQNAGGSCDMGEAFERDLANE